MSDILLRRAQVDALKMAISRPALFLYYYRAKGDIMTHSYCCHVGNVENVAKLEWYVNLHLLMRNRSVCIGIKRDACVKGR